jgi:hypothetical protein
MEACKVRHSFLELHSIVRLAYFIVTGYHDESELVRIIKEIYGISKFQSLP